MSQEKPTGEHKPHNGRPVIHYILVLFIVTFLMMTFSLLMHQRTTSEGLGQLQHSFSAMQSLQSQQETVIELQNALSEADDQRQQLEDTISALQETQEQDKLKLTAMQQLHILQQQYLAEEYDHCRATLQTMETLGLETLLNTKREYSVPSPSETFQTIKAELAALEAAEETPAEAGEETPATP